MVRRRMSLSCLSRLSRACLGERSCGEPVEGIPEDARLPARRAYSSERRTAILFALAALPSSLKLRRDKPLSPAPHAASSTSGFPVSWSQQVIHEISGYMARQRNLPIPRLIDGFRQEVSVGLRSWAGLFLVSSPEELPANQKVTFLLSLEKKPAPVSS
jgi:hypothetical protein